MSVEIIRNALCITVREAGEYAAFYIREGCDKRDASDPRYYCELTVHSSFGNVGYYWSHMGCPAHEFFDNDDLGYLMGKLFGPKVKEFDGQRTERELKRMLIQERKQGEHTREKAREIYDAIDMLEAFDTVEQFYDAFCSYEELIEWLSPGDIPTCQKTTHAALGLWALWPQFVAALKTEAVAKEHPNVQPIR